ncbi:glycosyl hydrolase 115 family protein [Mucilaginibacter aquatilis]|nr:glycosyl hydrolase 115 family protein [Mucilaginibacter aquatilis]
MQKSILFIVFATLVLFVTKLSAKQFEIVTPGKKVSIVYTADGKLDSIVAHLLAADIKRVSGYQPQVLTNLKDAKGNVIIIGTTTSALISNIKGGFDTNIKGGWERYSMRILSNPVKNVTNALVIAGSDLRGTAYGVFSLSEKIGVSPWYWWADVEPAKRKFLTVDIDDYTSQSPSVKYRGIFINDEDWGLQPWAAKTFEPETGNIGPKTYAKVFELLLRLKANLIWPAMHPSTKAFYSYPGNKEVATDYQIVIGSSHAEPMLRNNVGEWDEKIMGHFNYVTNKNTVYKYWEDRVKESSGNNAMFTLGMRGVHDSGMEGVKSSKDAIPLIEQIFTDQRGMLKKYINRDATKVPQVFTIYKEVLDIYEAGLKVPEDVTLVWPDDNYGYIQRLSNNKESKRLGGSGVYYHASYWGRPHDYLWLSTTHPGLMREEMTKAYTLNARTVWVVNVGDIKPAEYNLQLFADMAYKITPFMSSSYSNEHLQNWVGGIFGRDQQMEISQLMWQYYNLAFERKPEFMGWSQTEPTTQTKLTAYSHNNYGDQAQQRINAYGNLQNRVGKVRTEIAERLQNAFYELVQYPLTGAALMNKKFLYHDKAVLYASEGRISAGDYKRLSEDAYKQIMKETDYYNNQLAQGKWKGMMSMQPRSLPVFNLPHFNMSAPAASQQWNVYVEGYKAGQPPVENSKLTLPIFDKYNRQRYFIDVALGQSKSVKLSIKPSAKWIVVDQNVVSLSTGMLKSQQRLTVRVNWEKVPPGTRSGYVNINYGMKNIKVNVELEAFESNKLTTFDGPVESAGQIMINASSGRAKINNRGQYSWQRIVNLGSAGGCLQALPLLTEPDFDLTDTAAIRGKQASVTYSFCTLKHADAAFSIYTLPTSPLNQLFEMRYAVSIDGGPLKIVNFKTVGRSNEWKENVLSNSAVRTVNVKDLKAGMHSLTIYQVDPGVILDRIFINLNNVAVPYGSFPVKVIQKFDK